MSDIEEDVNNKIKRQTESTIKYYKNIDNIEEVPIDILRAMHKDILAEREQDKKRIQELEEENTSKQKAYDDCYCEYKHYKQFESIPKQAVEDEIENLKKMLKATMEGKLQKYTPGEILLKINTLEELLEGEK